MLLILCPLKFELECLREALKDSQSFEVCEWQLDGGKAYVDKIKGKDIYFGYAGVGERAYSQKLEHLLKAQPEIQKVICLGGAGALDSNLELNQVVVAEQYKPLNDLLNLSQIKTLKVLTVDEAITSSERAEELFRETECSVVAMEGEVASELCERHSVAFSELRVVTDHCDGGANPKAFKARLPSAMSAISTALNL